MVSGLIICLFVCSWDEQAYKEWKAGVDEACSFNLSQPLLMRNEETKLISVNFDPQLTAVLREVKYMQIRQTEETSGSAEEIPGSAGSMYERNDTLWQYLTHLDQTVHLYNKVRNTVTEVEFPLIETQIDDIDVQLEKAVMTLNWNSEGEFILWK